MSLLDEIAGATKYDEGKPRWDLAPMKEFEDIVKIMTFGANKYADNGWKGVDKKRYIAAMMRHITAYMNGECLDEESGMSHMAHAACNAVFIMYLDKVDEIDRFEIQEVLSGGYNPPVQEQGSRLC